jgi:hypothetical protein
VYRGIPGLFIENEWLQLNFLQHESPGRHAGHKDKKKSSLENKTCIYE